jgi:hypothetical protein
MPRVNEVILDKVLAAFESSRGVYVPTATRVVAARMVMNYDHPLANIPDTSGTFSARRTPVYGRPNVGLTATDVGTYEDLPWHFQMALRGGVAGVAVPGASGAYEYEFVPSLSVDDLQTASFQAGDPGNKYKIAQAFINSWTIRCDGDSTDEPAWMFEAEYLARSLDTLASFTNVAPHDREAILAPGTKVYIDDGSGDFGDTQIIGKVINFSVTGNNAGHLKGFLEDETEYGPDSLGRGERVFDAQITMEFEDDDEFANYRSTTPVQRKIRLRREGSEIVTGTNKSAELDIAGYWSSWSPGDREGNKTATFGLAAYFDDVLGYDFAARVVNDLATLP